MADVKLRCTLGQGLNQPRTRRANDLVKPDVALDQLRTMLENKDDCFRERTLYILEQMVRAIEASKPNMVGISGLATDAQVPGHAPLEPDEVVLQFDTTALPLEIVATLCDMGTEWADLDDRHSIRFFWSRK